MKKLRRTFADMDKSLLIVTLILFVFGLLNIVTASSSEATDSNVSLYYYFFRQLEMIAAGFVIGLIIIKNDTKTYGFFGFLGYIGIGLLLVYLSLRGQAYRGSLNWIKVGPFRFQPSEFAKPFTIIVLSLLFEKFSSKLRNKKVNHYDIIGIIITIGLIYPVIIFLQKDLGTATILLGIFGVMFISSPILRIEKFRIIIFLLIVAVFGGIILMNTKGYILSEEQKDRLDFINPCSKYEVGGYQVCNGYIAINNGGLLGLGPGKSRQKYSYIPEPHTDSVFAIVSEEYGFLKCSLIFFAYLFILYRITKLACNANTFRGRFMCLGVATYIFMHIFINLGGLFGVIPLTGVPLPFLSYGGSFTISLIIALAIVQRVHIETRNQKIKL